MTIGRATSMITELSSYQQKSTDFQYKAFISYSHKDSKQARRLHRRLENYRLPKSVSAEGQTLRPIFRDRDDFGVSSVLDDALRDKLRASENLIVICSPNAAASKWVNQEIRFFKSLGRADKIFAVVIAGEPFAERSGISSALECFPDALKYDFDASGNRSEIPTEPLAADIRRKADGLKLATTKLVSGLLGLGLDKLVRRDMKNARRRIAGVVTASFAIISSLGFLTWSAHSSQLEANARKADAEDFVEFMLVDLRQELEAYGRLDLMESVGDKAISYYDQFQIEDFDDNENGRRARTLQFIGELKYTLGEVSEAESYFMRSYGITKSAMMRTPDNPARVKEHGISSHLKSLIYRHRGAYDEEAVFLREYEKVSQTLTKLTNSSLESVKHLARAKTNLGRVNMRLGSMEQARAQFQSADILLTKAASNSPRLVTTTLHLAENLSWLAQTYRMEGDNMTAYNLRRRQSDMLQRQSELHPNDFRLLEANVYAKLGLGNAARHISEFEEAVRFHEFALRESSRALALEPEREKMMRAKTAALLGLMSTSIEGRKPDEYNAYRHMMKEFLAEPAVKAIEKNVYWQERLPSTLSEYDAKITRVAKL